mmetsp:Transcript_6892/g.13019  ORF Transcript_6892/g.13019 Transcript_6892/m.13019 type:complete len:213 (+) Transcript_6892:1174-1812(+)
MRLFRRCHKLCLLLKWICACTTASSKRYRAPVLLFRSFSIVFLNRLPSPQTEPTSARCSRMNGQKVLALFWTVPWHPFSTKILLKKQRSMQPSNNKTTLEGPACLKTAFALPVDSQSLTKTLCLKERLTTLMMICNKSTRFRMMNSALPPLVNLATSSEGVAPTVLLYWKTGISLPRPLNYFALRPWVSSVCLRKDNASTVVKSTIGSKVMV